MLSINFRPTLATSWLLWIHLQSSLICTMSQWWSNTKGQPWVSSALTCLRLQRVHSSGYHIGLFVVDLVVIFILHMSEQWLTRERVSQFWSVGRVEQERQKPQNWSCNIWPTWEAELRLKGGALSSKFWRCVKPLLFSFVIILRLIWTTVKPLAWSLWKCKDREE